MCLRERLQFLADFFGRASHGAHGDHDAQHGGDNAEAGQGVGYAGKRGGGLLGVMVMNLKIKIECAVDFVCYQDSISSSPSGFLYTRNRKLYTSPRSLTDLRAPLEFMQAGTLSALQDNSNWRHLGM